MRRNLSTRFALPAEGRTFPGRDASWFDPRLVRALEQVADDDAFSELARVSAAHHERLDGKGYSRGLMAEDICLETRVITTADIFDAISAERPCRGAVPIPKTLETMAENVGIAIDAQCFDALKQALACLPG